MGKCRTLRLRPRSILFIYRVLFAVWQCINPNLTVISSCNSQVFLDARILRDSGSSLYTVRNVWRIRCPQGTLVRQQRRWQVYWYGIFIPILFRELPRVKRNSSTVRLVQISMRRRGGPGAFHPAQTAVFSLTGDLRSMVLLVYMTKFSHDTYLHEARTH